MITVEPMRVCGLLNANAGTGEAVAALRDAMRARGWTVREPADGTEFISEVRRAAEEKFDRLVLAGGDGTIHAAVNALIDIPARPALAIVPLGTGNDLARTLAVPLTAPEALALVETGRVRRLDAIAVSGDCALLVINAATGGFAGQVTSNLTSDRKQAWGAMAYLREAAAVALDPPRWKVSIRYDGGTLHEYDALNVVVANGRTAGGGLSIAPKASVEDGRLDVLVVTAATALDRTVVSARVLAGDYDRDDDVQARRARHVEVRIEPAMPFSFDGEECLGAHFVFAVRPKAVAFVVGRGYRKRSRRLAGFVAGVWHLFGRIVHFIRSTLRALSSSE